MTYQCSQYAESLQICFGVSVNEDNIGIHPETFCQKCYYSLKNHQKAKNRKSPTQSQQMILPAQSVSVYWTTHYQ